MRRNSDGSYELPMLVITDLDHDTKVADKKHTWRSLMKKGLIHIR